VLGASVSDQSSTFFQHRLCGKKGIMFSLEKTSAGRFDVHAVNGSRAGAIIGGAGTWCAEVGNRVVGHFPTKEAAAEAILKDQGIEDIFVQMQAIIESPDGLLKRYKDDFYRHDRSFVDQWSCATSVLWVVRPSGTHTVPLDLPFTQREGVAVLDAVHPDYTGTPWALYHIDAISMKVKPITEANARSLVAQSPKYGLNNGFITSNGTAIASVTITPANDFKSFVRRCYVTIKCNSEPSNRTLAILQRMAFFAVTQKEGGDRFSAPASIEIWFEKSRLYEWLATELN
jgi:hypothetical protein